MKQWLFSNANRLKLLLNIWPPFLFSGIKIVKLTQDYRYCKIILKNWSSTKNANGTQFGGSLFSMTDPIYSLMLMGIMGNKYYIWDKSASIDFIKPGIGKVYLECQITDEWLKSVIENTQSGEKYLPEIKNTIYDSKDNIVATVNRTLYIRLKPVFRLK